MRVYQFAREINRPHRGVVQLLRELGYDVPSHMARLDDDQEVALREAVDRQSRGAVAVRPAMSSSAAIGAAHVAEIEAPADLEDEYAQDGTLEGAGNGEYDPQVDGSGDPAYEDDGQGGAYDESSAETGEDAGELTEEAAQDGDFEAQDSADESAAPVDAPEPFEAAPASATLEPASPAVQVSAEVTAATAVPAPAPSAGAAPAIADATGAASPTTACAPADVTAAAATAPAGPSATAPAVPFVSVRASDVPAASRAAEAPVVASAAPASQPTVSVHAQSAASPAAASPAAAAQTAPAASGAASTPQTTAAAATPAVSPTAATAASQAPARPGTVTPAPTPALSPAPASSTTAAPAPAAAGPTSATGPGLSPLKPGTTRSGTKPGTLLGTLPGFEPPPPRGVSSRGPAGAARPGAPGATTTVPPGARPGTSAQPVRPGAPGTSAQPPRPGMPTGTGPGGAVRPGAAGPGSQRPGAPAPGQQRPAALGQPPRPGAPGVVQRPGAPGAPGLGQRPGTQQPQTFRPGGPGAPGVGQRPGAPGTVSRPGAPGSVQRPGAPGTGQRPGTPGTVQRPGAPGVTRPGTAPIRPGMPRPGVPGSLSPASAARKPVKVVAAPKRRDKEEVLEDFEKEGIREQIEMVDTVVGAGAAPAADAAPAAAVPAGPTPGFEPGKLLRTVDLSAVEDTEPVAPVVKRRAVVNVGGRQIRTLQRRRQRGPKISLQASQELHVQTPINLKEFSQITGVPANDMIKRLIHSTGQLTWNLNSLLDEERVKFLAEAFSRKLIINQEQTAEDLLEAETDEADEQAEGDLEPRPAVVAILGHVDHGKTSLLDRIRNSNRVAEEFGGITQHIGAFQVKTADGRKVAFLDTPGHAAFTSMRARGARAADIVVLVVAADDGVMPQTEESITHATQAECPIVVALNKIDKPAANPTRVMQQLSAHGLTPEEWGGDTICCKVSALKGDGIPEMIENLAALAEILELKANPKAPPRGRVIEARKDPNRGVIATLLVEEGTLRKGDAVVAGLAMGRVRTMLDDMGRTVKEATPSTPVEVFGLDEMPDAGDEFMVVENERLARDAVDERRRKLREATVTQREMPSLEKLFAQAAAEEKSASGDGSTDLRIILKCDVKGSLEPIKGEIEKLRHPEVAVDLLYSGMGAVTKSDVDNAVSSGAVIFGFHVLSEPAARKEAERTGVEIRHYTVIYEMVDDLRAAMERKLAPEKKEHTTGHAEVRQVFQSSKVGTIAGCYVIDGTVHRTDFVRVYRDGRLIFGQERQIPVESLKRFKDDVREVREGFECGLRITAYQDVKEGDVLEFYEIREEQRKLGAS